MVIRRLIAPNIDFSALRRELRLPTQFSPAAQREADEAATRGPADATGPAGTTDSAGGVDTTARTGSAAAGTDGTRPAGRTARTSRTDRTDIEFVTIDPPTSMDLDQAMCLRRRANGYRVWYAIADVSAF